MARGTASCALVLLLVACDGNDSRRASPKPSPSPPVRADDPFAGLTWNDAPIEWSRPVQRTVRDTSGFAGSLACKRCHEQIYATYAKHSMAHTGMRRIETVPGMARIFDAGTPVLHEKSGFSYRPLRRGKQFFVEEALLDPDGAAIASWQQRVTHVFSAGTYGLALYSRVGTQLIHIPIDYYAKAARWDLDPMAFGGNPRLTNALGPFCASCHIDEPAQRFADPLSQGVGCERCHGPSKRHVETLAITDTVNPAKLPVQRQLDVCTQCHQSTNTIQRSGRDHFDFRAGEQLDGFRVNFIAEPPEADRMKLLAHSERMVRSACWQQSRDKMTCTTCHDPHVSSRAKNDTWWDGRCMQCHERTSCTESPERRASVGDHCWRCHMRAGSTGDVPLVSITDHWIQTRPPPIQPGAIAKPQKLVPWSTHVGDPVDDDEMVALRALGHADAGLSDEALRLAVAAAKKKPNLAIYRLLAKAYAAHRRDREALRALSAALQLDLDDSNTLLAFARTAFDTGAPADALRALDRMLAIDPEDIDALETKGIYLYRTNQRAAALELFQRAAATNRATGVSYVALAHDARGATAKQLEWLERAWREEPRDAWILDELATAATASGDQKLIDDVARRRAAIERSTPKLAPTRASNWLPR